MPLCIDLFCGLGGWAEGFLAEGYDVIGFDIERHDYGTGGYPGQLVLQDALTLHGSQFRNADIIVASPPCQNYSYMAMPWSRAKKMAAEIRESPARIQELNALFNTCFRIQLEASQAAGRQIPLVVENVKGAQPWAGRAMANYGGYYLWGDVRRVGDRIVAPLPVFGMASVQASGRRSIKNDGGSWFAVAHNTESGKGQNPVTGEGVKLRDIEGFERTHPKAFGWKIPRTSPRSQARKAASAQIAMIPFPLANHIARIYRPEAIRTA